MVNIRVCLNEKLCAGYFQESMLLHRIWVSIIYKNIFKCFIINNIIIDVKGIYYLTIIRKA